MRRSTLILSIALALSVAVNMLVAGLILGHRWSGPPRDRHGDAGMMFDRSFAAVPRELRRPIRERLGPEGADLRAEMREVKAAQRAVFTALSARPFDPAAAAAAMAGLRDQVSAAQARLHETVIETMSEAQANGTLPPAQWDGGRREERR